MKKQITLLILLLGISVGIITQSFKPTYYHLKPIVTDPAITAFCGSYTQSPAFTVNTNNQIYVGKWFRSTTAVPCVTVNNKKNITFINCLFGDIVAHPTNNTAIPGNIGVYVTNSTNTLVRNCFFQNTSTGVYAQADRTVKADSNQFKNMQGPYPRGQAVQFNNVTGAGSSISYNRIEGFAGQCNPEDWINCYKTQGTPASPVRIVGNKCRGFGPSVTGAMITIGDGNGGVACKYIIVAYNIGVNCGADFLQIAGGTFQQVYNNKGYSKVTKYVSGSTTTYISHCGLNLGNYSGGPMNNNIFAYNQSRWYSGRTIDVGHPNDSVRFNKHASNGLDTVSIKWNTNRNGNFTANILPRQLLTTCNPIH